MINKEFIPYELALELKQLGFNEPCFGVFSFEKFNFGVFSSLSSTENTILVPTYSQAFRWFRENHKLHSIFEHDSDNYYYVIQGINDVEFDTVDGSEDGIVYQTYEEAEIACLKKLIELVKSTQG